MGWGGEIVRCSVRVDLSVCRPSRFGREYAKRLLRLANTYAADRIDIEHRYRRSADSRQPNDVVIVPGKVLMPNMPSRVKQHHRDPAVGIGRNDAVRLAQIAEGAIVMHTRLTVIDPLPSIQ